MPGTTRYSATFDRTYEEEDRVDIPPTTARRSRSQSWQANCGLDSRPYTPLGGRPPSQRSSSTDNGPTNGSEHIPTRTVAKTAFKAHNNPFQFVKVGTCPLYKKAEEQLKKAKEVKKPDVLKEEEEEWQSNLDSWKSRRRKMSEDVFRRAEEVKQFEKEEQDNQQTQKKTKTFSEMVESRAHRGRSLSLCLISSPMELQSWEYENRSHKNGSCSTFSGESEENSTVNSEDEGVSFKEMEKSHEVSHSNNNRANGDSHALNGSDSHNENLTPNNDRIRPKEGSYIDSGLESISSHRAGDTPDSGSDFSHDSNSSIDCDSPRAGVNILEQFSSKSNQMSTEDETINSFVVNGNQSNGHSSPNSESKSQHYEKSIESENEMYVDDFEELERQAATCNKGVYALNSAEGFPVHSLFPLSPVTELPSPEDAKSIISSLSSDISSLSNVEKDSAAINYKETAPVLSNIKDHKCDTINPEKISNQKESSINDKVTCKDVTTPPAVEKKKVKIVRKVKKVKKAITAEVLPLDALDLVKEESMNSISSTSSSNYQKKSPEPLRKIDVSKFKDTKSLATISQNNTSAKQIEDTKSPNIDSLSIVFQSRSNNTNSETVNNKVKESAIDRDNKLAVTLVADIPPVEKVAEEMEKLILEQLEEEERAKELNSAGSLFKSPAGSPEHLLIAPPKLADPPKEKPPPPPTSNEGSPKDPSLKRVNSTKRIKKEIHKRRSNFLGIDAAEENLTCTESSIPPPPALEEILKAEMELDRQGRLQVESASSERLTLEEKEMIQKEREIIESLESEERRKQLITGAGDYFDVLPKNSDEAEVEEQLQFLQNEQKRLELEKMIAEEQQLRLLEEVQLREREELVRQQEAKSTAPLSVVSSMSASSTKPLNSLPLSSPLSAADGKSNHVSNSDTVGDGKSQISALLDLSGQNSAAENVATQKPAVPPKPFKKKEAIRKERERLRQEQEALQREREEHRRKLQQEQEELLKQQQNSHAPAVPVSRLGPISPLSQPSFLPPLTANPNVRDVAPFPSRSLHAASNEQPVQNGNDVELMGPAIVRQKMPPPPRKPVKSDAWGQQKVTSVRKQNQDSLTENRYNKNHWLIQEAEMRRIAELKERQRKVQQLSCSQTHLAEDVACSNSMGVLVVPPPPPLNPHRDCVSTENMWIYGGQPGVPITKYPPPVVKEQLHTVYPQRTVSQQPPMKPSRVVPMERQEQMLSVSGHKKCSHCNEELANGAAMIIESLQLYYHIHCFQCCVCLAQLGNGSCGTDVRVRNQKLHCQNCYSNDEAGLKFSQV